MRNFVPTVLRPRAVIAIWSYCYPISHIGARGYRCGYQRHTDAERYCFCLEYKSKDD